MAPAFPRCRRSSSTASATRRARTGATTGDPIRHRLAEIRAPTLVVHGADDPIFPLGHALALEREIPGARLLVLEETGHLLPRAVWSEVVAAILAHTSAPRVS